MTKEATAAELVAIARDVTEHVRYFQELGVELVEPAAIIERPSPARRAEISNPTPVKAQTATRIPAAPKSSPTARTISTRSALFEDLTRLPEVLAKSTETFEEIHAEIGDCTLCSLCERRTNVVHTEGNRKARLMFVGEAPGADEDAQSRPFVGRAGQLLTKIIEAIGLKREEVLIGNVNRCRPPGNRPPTAEEAAICKPFLLREIASVQPDVIVVLGNTATKNLLDTKEGITRIRGQFQDYKGIKVMPTFHPAYLLRDPSKKRETWEDLKKVRDYLDQSAKQSN
jgi:uracil-DNA glycosylase